MNEKNKICLKALEQMDKAGKKYWENVWETSDNREAFDPESSGLMWYLKKYTYIQLHKLFRDLFSGIPTGNMKILEVGCANSIWLPYFAREYGFEVYGIDYSDVGCKLAERILENDGIKGKIICDDFINPMKDLSEQFDVVFSNGVVEHFNDTVMIMNKIASYVKEGGKIITLIPNIVGLIGIIQKYFNRDIYDKHVPITLQHLKEANETAGLSVRRCNYWLFINFGIINLKGLDIRKFSNFIKRGVYKGLCRFSNIVWLIEKMGIRMPSNRLTSPYIICIAEKME